MASPETSRRSFLIASLSGAGAAWFAVHASGILAASDYVVDAAQSGPAPAFAFFTADEAREVDAIAAQIIPTDDTPGAREARVVHFIDRALTTFEKDRQGDYRRGLAELQAEVQKRAHGTTRFSALSGTEQIAVLTALERTPFFNLVRTHTISGFFASPVHGGNANKVGWQLVSYDDSLRFTPPFGYYDAQAARR